MNSKREEFPAVSIGRTRLQNATGLEAHPLLSPRPASPGPSDNGSIVPQPTTRYLTYTPRHRVTPTAATTGTTVHPTSPQHQAGDATSKLQLMHLKAAAQTIGLEAGSLGWMMLEKLVLDSEVGDEWSDVWNAITSGKATLLLPLESAATNERITPDFMTDHVAICDGSCSSRNNAPTVTLSGLRGAIDQETLTFRSTINPSSKLFQDLYNLPTRTSTLTHLPPLPLPYPGISTISYPKFGVSSHTSSLPLPPRSHSSKPPLPPRPGVRPPAPPSRIGNPFASLFSGSKIVSQPPPPPPSPPASLRSLDSTTDSNAVAAEVSALAIDRRIIRKDIGREINKSLKSELKAALNNSKLAKSLPIPPWVTERMHEFTIDWYPFVSARSKGTVNHYASEKPTRVSSQKYVVNPIEENMEDFAERLQDFFCSLEQDMRVAGEPAVVKDKESESEAEDESQGEKGGDNDNDNDNDKMESELKIREIMETVECIITWLFYDRLFKQPTTDDASHDEALSNRIGALNMLDLGLGHLGIDLGEVLESDLNIVVKACGEMLGQLDICRSPSDKASVLVAAHKIVVDGLSRLPPVRLISEDEASENDVKASGMSKQMTSENKIVAETEDDSQNEPAAVINDSSPSLAFPFSNAVDSDAPVIAKPGHNPVTPVSKIKAPPPPPLSLGSGNQKLHVPAPVKEPTPVSGDVLFPIMIFSVVKAIPPHLVSNLLFTQRFRNQSIGGEESYCLINMMAVAEFLENVDMAALGLDSEKVLSTADLTPIPLNRSPVVAETPLAPGAVAGLRGRVEHAIADSANKVISGVVDSSFGILRSFIPNQGAAASSGRTTPGTPGRVAFGLLRRQSGFSIASLASSLPIAGRSRSSANNNNMGEETGQQMVSVSRPSSLKLRSPKLRAATRVSGVDEDDDDDDDDSGTSEESEGEEEAETGVREEAEHGKKLSGDTRSIRSFESMLSTGRDNKRGSVATAGHQRKTLSDRLASVSALATSNLKGSSPPGSRRSSMLAPHQRSKSTTSPVSDSRPASPALQSPPPPSSSKLQLAPPKPRFMECTPDDLRLSEIRELLRDYRRLAEGIRAVGGFDE